MTLDDENKVPAKFEDVKIRCLLVFSGWSPQAQMEALQSTMADQKRFSGALGLYESPPNHVVIRSQRVASRCCVFDLGLICIFEQGGAG